MSLCAAISGVVNVTFSRRFYISKMTYVLNRIKMAGVHKMALLLLLATQAVIVLGKKKVEKSDSESNSFSSEIETNRADNPRRVRQWQYEGIPIEMHPRRNQHSRTQRTTRKPTTTKTATRTTTTTTTTTPAPVYPPLSPRFRRIYNADETAKIEDYPFMAAVLVNKELWCGGALISADRVLTAAHCLQLQYNNRFFREYVRMLSVRVGSTNATAGGEYLRVTEIFFHPNYKPETLEFNFAVLGLHKNVSSSKDSKANMIDFSRSKIVPIDKTVTFLGWGSVLGVGGSGGQVLLQKLDLPVYDLADCQEIYGRDLVTKNNFCAGYISKRKNVCNHDAGGPAVLDGMLLGILSFSSRRCDEADKPAVFSVAGAAAEWLDSISEVRTKSEPAKRPQWVNMVE